jgi:hypothetical protein
MIRSFSIALALAAAWPWPSFAALPQHDPDWPCQQIKVPELSPAAVWSGPPIDEALKSWSGDKQIADLVDRLSQRRIPIEEAGAAVRDFASTLKPEEKAGKLTMLFAGLFDTLNDERDAVMAGLDRYGRSQKALAETIREAQSRLSDLNSSGADPQQASALNDQLVAQTRIFNDRRSSLTFVCEVPTLIEQRLFALGREIEKQLSAKAP